MASRRLLGDNYDTEGLGTYPGASPQIYQPNSAYPGAPPTAGTNQPEPPMPGPASTPPPPPPPDASAPPPPLGHFARGMGDDQVRQLANQYISAGGVKNIDNGEYWVEANKRINDPAYLEERLKQGIGDQAGYNGVFGNIHTPNDAAQHTPGYQPPPAGGVGGFSSGPLFGNEVFQQLKGLFPNGAFNQDVVNRRTENARENLQRFQKSQSSNDRAALASRGLVGSGPEQTAQNQLERSVADQYTNAASGIYANESQAADSRMMSALQTAAGMTQSQAQQAIDWFRAQNDFTLGQGQLGLGYGNLDLNRMLGQGNLAIGNQRLGLDAQGQQWQMDHGDTQQLIDLINQLYSGANTSAQGHR